MNYKNLLRSFGILFLIFAFALTGNAQDRIRKDIESTGEGKFIAPLNIGAGVPFGISFDDINVLTKVTIEGTEIENSFTSKSGEIKGDLFTFTLEPGQYQLIENYSGKVASSTELIGKPTIPLPEIVIARPLDVTATTEFTVTINSEIYNFRATVEGDFVGEIRIRDTLGESVEINLVSARPLQAGQDIVYTAKFTARLSSETIIEREVSEIVPPIVEVIEITFEPSPPIVISKLTARADAKDPNGGEVEIKFQWFKNGEVIDGANDHDLFGQFAKGDLITVQAIAINADGLKSVPKTSDEIEILNSAPIIAQIPDQKGLENTKLEIQINAKDQDGDAIEISVKSDPELGEIEISDDLKLVIDLPEISVAERDFEIGLVANDGETDGKPIVFQLRVGNQNQPPIITIDQESPIELILTDQGIQTEIAVTAVDPDGDTVELQAFSISQFSVVKNALREFNQNGSPIKIDLPPDALSDQESIVVEIELVASDGFSDGRASKKLTVIIKKDPNIVVNLPPILTIPDQRLQKHDDPSQDLIVIDVVAEGFATDDQPMTFEIPSDRAIDGVEISDLGVFTINYAELSPNKYIVPIVAKDDLGAETVQIVHIQIIENENNPPTISVKDQIVAQGELLTFVVVAEDPDLTPVKIGVERSPAWIKMENVKFPTPEEPQKTTATFSGEVPFDLPAGEFELKVFAIDPANERVETDLIITVSQTNRPPIFPPIQPITIREDQMMRLPILAIDPDGDDLTFELIKGIGKIVENKFYQLDLTDNFTIAEETNGKTVVKIKVTDRHGASDTADVPIIIHNFNRPPLIDVDFSGEVVEVPTEIVISVKAIDPDLDDADQLKISAKIKPELPIVIDGNRVIIDVRESGDFMLTVIARDPEGATVEKFINITAEDPDQLIEGAVVRVKPVPNSQTPVEISAKFGGSIAEAELAILDQLGNVIIKKTLENEGDDQISVFNFSRKFPPGGYAYYLVFGDQDKAKGKFAVPNSPTRIVLPKFTGVLTGKIPITVLIEDLDKIPLTIIATVDGKPITFTDLPNPATDVKPNQLFRTTWASELDLPNSIGETHTLKILVRDALGKTEIAAREISVLNTLPKPKLQALDRSSGSVIDVLGKKPPIADLGVELHVNGQRVDHILPDREPQFVFKNLELEDGKNLIQARLFAVVASTINLPTIGDTFELKAFESRLVGEFSDPIGTAVDADAPKIQIISPNATTSLNMPKFVASISDQNLDHVIFYLGRNRAMPKVNLETGLAVFVPSRPMPPGNHKFIVIASDTAGNKSEESLKFLIDPSAKDTTPPTLAASKPSDGQTVAKLRKVAAKIADAQSAIDLESIKISANGEAVEFETVPIDIQTVEILSEIQTEIEGKFSILIDVADQSGNSTTLSWSFTVDSTPPTAVIDPLPPISITDAINVNGSSESRANLRLFKNGEPYTAISADADGNFTFHAVPLKAGRNEFYVIAADNFGNIGTSSDPIFTIYDLKSPAIKISAPIENQTIRGQNSVMRAIAFDDGQIDSVHGTVTFDDQIVDPIELDFDESGLGEPTRITGTLPNIPENLDFTLTITVHDKAGNFAESSVTARIGDPLAGILDTSPPIIHNFRIGQKFVDKGVAIIRDRRPEITAEITDLEEVVDAVEALIDGVPIEIDFDEVSMIATAILENDLADGKHKLEIRAKDLAGNVARFFAKIEIRTELRMPNLGAVSSEVTKDDKIWMSVADIGADLKIEWLINGVPVATHDSDQPIREMRKKLPLDPGTNLASIRVTDAFGNEKISDAIEVIRDTESPQIRLRNPISGSKVRGDQPITVDLEFSDLETEVQKRKIRIISPSGEKTDLVDQTNSTIVSPEEGVYRIFAKATDLVGNTTESFFAAEFEVDNTPPKIEILVPADGEILTNQRPQISAYIEPDDVDPNTITVTLNGNVVPIDFNETLGQLNILLDSDLPSDLQALEITAIDSVGNSANANRNFMVDPHHKDEAGPTLANPYPADGSAINTDSPAILEFMALDQAGVDPSNVILTINGVNFSLSSGDSAMRFDRGKFSIFLNRLSATQFSEPFQLDPLALASLEDPLAVGSLEDAFTLSSGTNEISIEVSDLESNFSTMQWSFDVVLTAPNAPTINTLDPLTADDEISVSGSVTTTVATIEIIANGTTIKQNVAVDQDGNFTADGIRLVEGENKISAIAIDLAGNQSEISESQIITLDTEKPSIRLDLLPSEVGSETLIISGSISDDTAISTATISVNDGAPSDLTIEDGSFSAEISLNSGENKIVISAIDLIGNVAEITKTIDRDTVGPETAPTDLDANAGIFGTSIELSWTADPNAENYNVYRSDTLIATDIFETHFDDAEIFPGSTVFYFVKSVDTAGNEGISSDPINVALITSSGGKAEIAENTSVTFRDGTLSTSASVSISDLGDASWKISVKDASGFEIENFDAIARLTLPITSENVQIAKDGIILENSTIDTETMTVSAEIDQPGIYSVTELSVTQNPWDVNGDNEINIFDLVLVASHFGEVGTDLEGDANADETINIFDLVLVASHFGETYGTTAAPIPISDRDRNAIGLKIVAEKSQPNRLKIDLRSDTILHLNGFQFDLRFDRENVKFIGGKSGGVFRNRDGFWIEPTWIDDRLRFAAVAIYPLENDSAEILAELVAELNFEISGEIEDVITSFEFSDVWLVDLEGKSIPSKIHTQIDLSWLSAEKLENALLPNFPNPFNPETWIPFSIDHDSEIELIIYNTKGEIIRSLDLGFVEAGNYTTKSKSVYWDGRNDRGESVASGVYFYSIRSENFSSTRKMIILK